ncbi:MAG: multicopper oxidase family protein [Candidatus Cyclobacteriaceae bacterium M3_2C_046]
MKRREFINRSTLAAGAFLTLPGFFGCRNEAKDDAGSFESASPEFNPDLDVRLTAKPTVVNIMSDKQTPVYSYLPEIVKGDKGSVQALNENYLGPIFRVKKGDKIRVRFINEIERESVIHWHGLHLPSEMDGHPMYAINPGKEFIYEFKVVDRAGTYWFHPHPDKITGPQVYQGLAGMFLVSDNEENSLDLPSGEYDMPLIIQDRNFDAGAQLVYLQGRMSQMMGFLGDHILVNGSDNAEIEIKNGSYRLRILNGSNSRIYKLAWSDGAPVTVIGTDGGLLEAPREMPYLMLGPGERYEVWRDFDSNVTLESLEFNPGMMGDMMGGGGMMNGGMMGNQSLPNGSRFTVVEFNVTGDGLNKNLPLNLTSIDPYDLNDAVNPNEPRPFNFFMERMQWTINGATFQMKEAADWEKVQLNTLEVWEFINGADREGGGGMMGGGMMQKMMQMPHPVHIHGLQFQIIERNVDQVDPGIWNTIKDGFVNEGWQDTFLLMPDMRVKILLKFRDFKGLYVYHCHNLEHEDMGMMRNYLVE